LIWSKATVSPWIKEEEMKCCPACGRDYEGAENIQVVMLREAKMEELRSALAGKEKECEELHERIKALREINSYKARKSLEGGRR
jgi:predicted  nucleic acid-binding Zn-ribbon protein